MRIASSLTLLRLAHSLGTAPAVRASRHRRLSIQPSFVPVGVDLLRSFRSPAASRNAGRRSSCRPLTAAPRRPQRASSRAEGGTTVIKLLVRVAATAALGLSLIAASARADDAPAPATDPAATTATTPATVATVTSTTPTVATTAAPCAGTGAVALLTPGAASVVVGPALAAVQPSGVTVSSVVVPSDGSLLEVASLRAGTVGCRNGGRAPGGSALSLDSLRLFGGAITADAISSDLVPSTSPNGSGWHLRASVTRLAANGKTVQLTREVPDAVGDWGVIRVPARAFTPAEPLSYWAAAFEILLRKPRGGYPAGTIVLVGYVSASEPSAALPPVVHAAPRRMPSQPRRVRIRRRRAHKHVRTSRPLELTPQLRAGPYVFPVFGQVAFADTYGAPRSDVSGGWHHGDDVFAPLGTPILAVADGVVYSVGWNRVGGWRLWLRDRRGNRFYYAHLSGYTSLARNGTHVEAGDVLAFVGHTGDAFATPTHVHFEVHPVSLLRLGYDGAVDPTRYLQGWRRLGQIHLLRPVALPAGAASDGSGAVTDYRKLLAVRGLLPRRHARARLGGTSPPPPTERSAAAARLPGLRRVGSGRPVLISSVAALLGLLALVCSRPVVRAFFAARLGRRD